MNLAQLPKDLGFLLTLVGALLVSASALILEITITRIFSATIFYHYAFVAVSVAILGWGLGGALSHFLRKKLSLAVVAAMTMLASISIPFYLWAMLQLPMSPSLLNFYCILSTIPFFLGGSSVSSVLQILRHRANKVYFADLTGASLGCLLVEPVLSALGAETSVLLLGVTTAMSGILFSFVSGKRQLVAFSLVVMLATSIVFFNNVQNRSMTITNAPGESLFKELQSYPKLVHVLTKWNSFSRIDVVEGLHYPILAQIKIDAGAETDILNWDGKITQTNILKKASCSMLCYMPYYVVSKPKSTLIIGSGGGQDVIYALIAGSSRVVAVEINPIITDVVKGYGSHAGNVYQHDGVELVVDDGRNFVSRSNEKFDLEVLTLVDTYAAVYAGGYALSENYLYTVEAFEQYLDHLTDRGILAIARWTVEVPELLSIAITAMENRGMPFAEASRHVAILSWQMQPGRPLSLLMIKKTSFSLAQAQLIQGKIQAMGSEYESLYLPYLDEREPYSLLFNGSDCKDCPIGATRPATDDRPYYFWSGGNASRSLLSLVEFATIAAAAFLIVPFLKRKRTQSPISPMVLFVIYFAALGTGFMFLEIPLIQKFILFLGYPTRALSVVLFSLLLSSGLGSFLSGSMKSEDYRKRAIMACSTIVAIALCYYFLLKPLFVVLLPQDAVVRMVAAFLLILPLGFFMGIPFPTGIVLVSSNPEVSIPWMWAINGSMSVMGSVLATATGILIGLNSAILMAVISYAIALLSAARWKLGVTNQT